MFGGVASPGIRARREVGIVVACCFNIRRTQALSATIVSEATIPQNVLKVCQLSVCRCFPLISSPEAVRQLPDRIARFPAPHWMPWFPLLCNFLKIQL
jgi:hypothetical protein